MIKNFQCQVFRQSRIKHQTFILLAIVIIAASLRFYKISSNPPGLYWDEAAFGYDAYSVLKTGHDHHGAFMPLFFESFGDWKLPGYFYLLVPSIKLFGLNEFAIRFPSALLGTLTIPVVFLLVKRLTRNPNLSLSVSLFLAISPWHIQFSRAGFESIPALFFAVLALLFFLCAMDRKNSLFFAISFILFTLTMYTYHSYRIFTPLFIAAIFVIYAEKLKRMISRLIFPILVAGILFIPLFLFTLKPQGSARAASQSAFSNRSFEDARLEYDQKSKKPLRFLSKYIYQKPLYYTYVAFRGYLDHLSPGFLFFSGDQIGRHSQVDMGQIETFEIILIVSSLFAIKLVPAQTSKIILVWLLISPIPASIVLPTPHAQRALQMSLPLAFFSGLGLWYIFRRSGLLAVKIVITFMIFYSFTTYTHLLFVHYPRKFAADWQDGYKQMVNELVKYQNNFDKIYITNINRLPYIYVLLYQKYDPQKFMTEGGTENHFSKYTFVASDADLRDKGRLLYVAPSWQKVDGKLLTAVNDTYGRQLYTLWEVNEKH